MAGYIGTKAALLSTTTASVGGDSTVGGDLFVDAVYNESGDNDSGIDLSTNDVVAVKTANTERLRVDSSGNLLVGTTDIAPTSDGETGFVARSSGYVIAGMNNQQVMLLNRSGTDGDILQFRKSGSAVGSIGNASGSDIIYLAGADTGIKVLKPSTGIDGLLPCNSNGSNRDNLMDLGSSTVRWDDIYATNGTIQTSDRNEKQDIAALTATEMLVAARISAMFKTFRWIDKVADNPNARTHTGIIAQDVQQAFADEGLDAGDYSLFISTTWWEANGETYDTQAEAPEGATERTRMGIRYPELLSFIAAYNEQRFTDIEARLTALEAV